MFFDVRSLSNYQRDKIDNVNNASDGKLVNYKTTVIEKTGERLVRFWKLGDANWPTQPPVPTLNVEVTFPLKYLSNNWRFLDLLLIKCEIELHLAWAKNCVLIEHHNNMTGVNFMITNTNLYVPSVSLFINDNISFL